jgi:hypothetical protein
MPAWFDQNDAEATEGFKPSCCEGPACIDAAGANERSAQPCGCDPGCRPKPYVCQEHLVREEALDILEAIIYASDGCVGHRDCNHSMLPWQRARAILSVHRWNGEGL